VTIQRSNLRLGLPLTLAALAALWAAMLVLGGQSWDRTLLVGAYAGGQPTLVAAARWLTEAGGSTVLVPMSFAGALILFLVRRDWRAPILFLAITLSGRLLVELQKDWLHRLRPDANEHLVAAQSYAFPSGHSANAMMVWVGLALLFPPRWRGPALAAVALLVLAVGASRVMLGVHWPSDVVGGWSFGLFWLLLLRTFEGSRKGYSRASR